MVSLKAELAVKITKKNNACKPARGTCLFFRLDLKNENKINEKISEQENSTKKDANGKLMAIIKKNHISPSPNPLKRGCFSLSLL